MSSQRRIAANRRNAKLSCGPRTPAGKACVARNALRHGLGVSILKNPKLAAEVDQLARVLAGNDIALLPQTRIIAEAELELARIQVAKVSLMNAHIAQARSSVPVAAGAGLNARSVEVLAGGSAEPDEHHLEVGSEIASEILGAAMIEISPQVWRLHRYERRAWSRRRRAMHNLLQAKANSAPRR